MVEECTAGTLIEACRLAVAVYQDKVDDKGRPYILTAMERCLQGTTREEQVLGLLHAVLDHPAVTFEFLDFLPLSTFNKLKERYGNA